MRRLLPGGLSAVWWGSLTTLGFFVVPMLFLHLPTPAMAGAMAARLFSVQSGISVACAVGLLLVFRSPGACVSPATARFATAWVLAGAMLALLVEFAIAPRIVARENLALWHRVGSAMYFGQWVCALVVLARVLLSPVAHEPEIGDKAAQADPYAQV